MVDAHHGCHLLDRFSVQMRVSSGYEDEIATQKDIHSDFANSLPLETLHRGTAMRR